MISLQVNILTIYQLSEDICNTLSCYIIAINRYNFTDKSQIKHKIITTCQSITNY